MTTIKVTTATRDRLKAAARADRSTLEEFLDRLVSEHERRGRLSAMRAAVGATAPDVMAAYEAEAAEWERAEAAPRG